MKYGDLIYKQKAIDEIKSIVSTMSVCLSIDECHGMKRMQKMAVRVLEDLPPAQPELQWIPCSERLPDNNRQVLVYALSVHFALAKYDEMRNANGTYEMQWVTFDAWKPFYKIKDVIAWMPLPEPYKERRKE